MSSIYFKCSLNSADRIGVLKDKMAEWANCEQLNSILTSFNAELPKLKRLEDTIEWLLNFSQEWDYRKKQKTATDAKTQEAARWLVTNDELTPQQIDATMNGINTLGLVGVTKPMLDDYDYIVALGGARLSCLLRPKYAAEIIKTYAINPKYVVMLSGTRPIADSEREATNTYAVGAKTEFDLMNCGLGKSFGIGKNNYKCEKHDDINLNNSWAIRTYDVPEKDFQVLSIAAPSTDPENRRANSADTYKFFFEQYKVPKGSRLLMITSQIYVPYQQLEAIRTLALRYDVVVETIGFPNEWSGQMHGMQQPGNYLQEIRSTIQAMGRFLKEVN